MLVERTKTELHWNNVPSVLERLIKEWASSGKQFYLGPENMFQWQGRMLSYPGCPTDFPREYGSWHAYTGTYRRPTMPLYQSDIEAIARCFRQHMRAIYALVYLSNRCNAQCLMCSYHQPGNSYRENYPDMQRIVPLETAVERLIRLHEYGIQSISLDANGELLAYPHWRELLIFAAKKFSAVHIITNGLLLTNDNCLFLARYATAVDISLNAATPQTYAAVTGITNKRLIANAFAGPGRLQRYGINNIGVSFCYSGINQHEGRSFLDRWMGAGLRRVRILDCFYQDAPPAIRTEPAGLCRSSAGSLLVLTNGHLLPCCGMYRGCSTHSGFTLPSYDIADDLEPAIQHMYSDFIDNKEIRRYCSQCHAYQYGEAIPMRIGPYTGIKHGGTLQMDLP